MRTATVSSCILLAIGAAAAPTYELDATHSDLVVHVHKKGVFSAFEHDHFLHPQRWRGTLTFAPDHPEAATVELIVDAASLVDRQPQLKPADRAKVEDQIRSPAVLDAARFPEVRFRADQLELRGSPSGTSDGGQVLSGVLKGTLALHGRDRPIEVTVTARTNANGVRVRGAAAVKQTDFGIEPLHKAGLGVEDRVDIELDALFTARR
jgi:polyisoprenoid-binding protein YceI